jgi:ASCH domain-containing protein
VAVLPPPKAPFSQTITGPCYERAGRAGLAGFAAGPEDDYADSAGNRVAVIELTAVRVVRLAEVDLAHAVGEGEGYTSVAEWRAGARGVLALGGA